MDSKVRDGLALVVGGITVVLAAAGLGGHVDMGNTANLTNLYVAAFWIGWLIVLFGVGMVLWGVVERATGRSNLVKRVTRLLDDIDAYLDVAQVPGSPLPANWNKRQEKLLKRTASLNPRVGRDVGKLREASLDWPYPIQTPADWAAKERAEEIWRMERLRDLLNGLRHSTSPAISSQDQM
jgi:hypothetical protein